MILLEINLFGLKVRLFRLFQDPCTLDGRFQSAFEVKEGKFCYVFWLCKLLKSLFYENQVQDSTKFQ